MIQFFLIFNKMGQTRFAKYYVFQNAKERATLEGEVTRLYMGRRDDQVDLKYLDDCLVQCIRTPYISLCV